MQKIKNIIFDLGGIFIEIDFSKTKNAFAALGIDNFDDFFTQHTASSLFQQLETGEISRAEFFNRFRTQTESSVSDEQIISAWNAMLGHFPNERLQWLSAIKQQYKIFLFSNTNSIHYDAFQQMYNLAGHTPPFDSLFSKAYYSHQLGARKPNPESFLLILKAENLLPEETLFIDDTPSNIEGAKKAGLQTQLIQPPYTVMDLEL